MRPRCLRRGRRESARSCGDDRVAGREEVAEDLVDPVGSEPCGDGVGRGSLSQRRCGGWWFRGLGGAPRTPLGGCGVKSPALGGRVRVFSTSMSRACPSRNQSRSSSSLSGQFQICAAYCSPRGRWGSCSLTTSAAKRWTLPVCWRRSRTRQSGQVGTFASMPAAAAASAIRAPSTRSQRIWSSRRVLTVAHLQRGIFSRQPHGGHAHIRGLTYRGRPRIRVARLGRLLSQG